MTIFESKAIINRPVSEVYLFLADLNNHKQLMPPEVENWTSDYDTAKFSIQNMAKLTLNVSARVNNSEIAIIAIDQPPFGLEMKWELLFINNCTEATLNLAADLSMMLKILASGPLQKLTDQETKNLSLIFS